MNGVNPEDVTELAVKAASRRLTVNKLHFRQLQSSSNAIDISYVIRSSNSSLSYSALSTQLTEAVSTGVFDSALTANAQDVGATALVGCTSDTVTTAPVENSNDSNNSIGLSTDIIIGISVGAAVGLVALLCCCFVGLFAMSSEKRRESATTTAAHPKAVERKSPRKGSRNSSVRNTTDPDSPAKSKRKASETGKKSKSVKQDKVIEEGDIELAVPYSLNQRVDRGTDSDDPMLMYTNPMPRTNFRSASRRAAPPPSADRGEKINTL
jgi:hypothetical protein